MQFLLDSHKELLESQDDAGRPPLHTAACYGYREVCELLLKAGATIYTINKFGKNAIQEAQGNHRDDIVQLLTEWQKKK